MGLVKRDLEQVVLEKAEELAQKRFGISFDDCDREVCMRLWTDADQMVQENLIAAAEAHSEALKDYKMQLAFAKGEVCPECYEIRPGDDRVKSGMKCAEDAAYGIMTS